MKNKSLGNKHKISLRWNTKLKWKNKLKVNRNIFKKTKSIKKGKHIKNKNWKYKNKGEFKILMNTIVI